MGVDLRLLPVDCLRGGWGFSHTIIPLPRDYTVFDAIRAAKPYPIGLAEITSHIGARIPDGSMEGERSYGRLTRDSYGAPFTALMAGQLAAVLAEHLPRHPATAFVAACDADRWIVLDWH